VMAHRIVDLFETVQVDIQQRNAEPTAFRHRDGLPEPVVKQAAIWQVGQLIIMRQLLDALQRKLLLADIAQHGGKQMCTPYLISVTDNSSGKGMPFLRRPCNSLVLPIT